MNRFKFLGISITKNLSWSSQVHPDKGSSGCISSVSLDNYREVLNLRIEEGLLWLVRFLS